MRCPLPREDQFDSHNDQLCRETKGNYADGETPAPEMRGDYSDCEKQKSEMRRVH